MFTYYCASEIDNLLDSIFRVLVFQHHLEFIEIDSLYAEKMRQTYLMLLTLESAFHVHWIGICLFAPQSATSSGRSLS